jgi:hypothetical protein
MSLPQAVDDVLRCSDAIEASALTLLLSCTADSMHGLF